MGNNQVAAAERDAVDRLMVNPIIIGMFEELRSTGETRTTVTENGDGITPRWDLINSCSITYADRGGKTTGVPGTAPAKAIIELFKKHGG